MDRSAPSLNLHGSDPWNAILSTVGGVRENANREIGVPRFQSQVPTSPSDFRFNDFTFAPYHRQAFLIPALAPEVSAVLFLFWAEGHSWVGRPPAVFQIDVGDRCPRLLGPGEQTSQAGSAARAACAFGPSVDAAAVAAVGFAVAAVNAVAFAAEATVAAAVEVAEIAVAPVAAVDAVVFAAEVTVAVAVVVVEIAVAPVVVAAVAAAVAFVVAIVVRAGRPAGKTSPAAEHY